MNNTVFAETTDGLKLDYMMVYSELMINQQYDDRRLFLSLMDEDTMLLENNSLIPLNEGMISTVIEFLKKIVDSLARVIDRFVADIRKVVGMDAKFLANNKAKLTTGLKQIEKGDTIERYRDYTEAFKEFAKGDAGILTFNKNNISIDVIQANVDKWNTVENYATDQHIGGIDSIDKNEQISLKNKIINRFAGEPHNIKDSEITKPTTENQQMFINMYNFCYKGYGAVLDSIKADKDKINRRNQEITEKLDSIKRQSESNAPVPEQPGTAPVNEEKPQESTLDSTLSYYFLEDDNPAVGQNDKENNGPAKITHSDDNDPNAKEEGEKKEEDSNTKLANAIRSFYNAEMAVMSAKMKLSMDLYKQSMKIMRWYIGRLGGENTENKVDNKDKNTDTTHSPELK